MPQCKIDLPRTGLHWNTKVATDEPSNAGMWLFSGNADISGFGIQAGHSWDKCKSDPWQSDFLIFLPLPVIQLIPPNEPL